jgi:protein-arginine kinase activator protein McsA
MRCIKCDRILFDKLWEDENRRFYKCNSCKIIIDVTVHNISSESNLPIEEILKSVKQKPIDFKP